MNNLLLTQTHGYAETWKTYTESGDYKKACKKFTKAGLTKDFCNKVLQKAFNAGWGLLIYTFIKNITENEKRSFNPKLKPKKIK